MEMYIKANKKDVLENKNVDNLKCMCMISFQLTTMRPCMPLQCNATHEFQVIQYFGEYDCCVEKLATRE